MEAAEHQPARIAGSPRPGAGTVQKALRGGNPGMAPILAPASPRHGRGR
jgi:hypothetical protein